MNFKKAFKISIIFGLMLIMVMSVSVFGLFEAIKCTKTTDCAYGQACIASYCKSAAALSCGADLGCDVNVKKAANHEAKCINGKCRYQYKTTPGIQHAGGEIVGGEDIMVTTTSAGNSGTLGSLLGTLFANMNSGVSNAITSLGDASKKSKKLIFGAASMGLPSNAVSNAQSKVNDGLSLDESSSVYLKNAYVERAAYSSKSTTSSYANLATAAYTAGPACTLIAMKEGANTLYGVDATECTGAYAGMERVGIVLPDTTQIRMPGQNLKTESIGMVYCCVGKPQTKPVLTAVGRVTNNWNLYFRVNYKGLPTNCDIMMAPNDNTATTGLIPNVAPDQNTQCAGAIPSATEVCYYLADLDSASKIDLRKQEGATLFSEAHSGSRPYVQCRNSLPGVSNLLRAPE